MADIMDGSIHSEGWTEIQLNDPGIVAAERRIESGLKRAEHFLPKDLYMEIADSHVGGLSAYIDAAILYGIHTADVIQSIAANPSELSKYYLKNLESEPMEITH